MKCFLNCDWQFNIRKKIDLKWPSRNHCLKRIPLFKKNHAFFCVIQANDFFYIDLDGHTVRCCSGRPFSPEQIHHLDICGIYSCMNIKGMCKTPVSQYFLITYPPFLGSQEIPVLLLVLLPCSLLHGRNSAGEGSGVATAEILPSAGELYNLITVPNFCLLW